MKKQHLIRLLALLLTLCMAAPVAIASEGEGALDAYWALVGKPDHPVTGDEAIAWAVRGDYRTLTQQARADSLGVLAAVTGAELTVYAQTNGMPVAQVRHAWYMALAVCLEADIAVNPGEDQRGSLNAVLALFLSDDDIGDNERSTIRRNLTPAQIAQFSEYSGLPGDFLAFLMMDDDWDDDDWDDDDDDDRWDDDNWDDDDDDDRWDDDDDDDRWDDDDDDDRWDDDDDDDRWDDDDDDDDD